MHAAHLQHSTPHAPKQLQQRYPAITAIETCVPTNAIGRPLPLAPGTIYIVISTLVHSPNTFNQLPKSHLPKRNNTNQQKTHQSKLHMRHPKREQRPQIQMQRRLRHSIHLRQKSQYEREGDVFVEVFLRAGRDVKGVG